MLVSPHRVVYRRNLCGPYLVPRHHSISTQPVRLQHGWDWRWSVRCMQPTTPARAVKELRGFDIRPPCSSEAHSRYSISLLVDETQLKNIRPADLQVGGPEELTGRGCLHAQFPTDRTCGPDQSASQQKKSRGLRDVGGSSGCYGQ